MGDSKRTKSEMLFEEFCTVHSVNFQRLPEVPHRRQPDYELILAGQRVVFEIKQAEPNDEDVRETEKLGREGMVTRRSDPNDTADRVRNLMKEGTRQIKAYHTEFPQTPGVVVILDNASVGNRFTDPYIVQTAMFGWEQVQIEHSVDSPPQVIERGFGRRNDATVRPDKSNALSAVATLHEGRDFTTKERTLSLCFYHNQYSDNPFIPEWWMGDRIFHQVLSGKQPGHFQDWEDYPNGNRFD